jgi:hypothetical protein
MMTQEQYTVEKEYRIARNILLCLLSQKLISEQEFTQIDTKLKEKYRPIIGGLLS